MCQHRSHDKCACSTASDALIRTKSAIGVDQCVENSTFASGGFHCNHQKAWTAFSLHSQRDSVQQDQCRTCSAPASRHHCLCTKQIHTRHSNQVDSHTYWVQMVPRLSDCQLVCALELACKPLAMPSLTATARPAQMQTCIVCLAWGTTGSAHVTAESGCWLWKPVVVPMQRDISCLF